MNQPVVQWTDVQNILSPIQLHDIVDALLPYIQTASRQQTRFRNTPFKNQLLHLNKTHSALIMQEDTVNASLSQLQVQIKSAHHQIRILDKCLRYCMDRTESLQKQLSTVNEKSEHATMEWHSINAEKGMEQFRWLKRLVIQLFLLFIAFGIVVLVLLGLRMNGL